METELRPSLDQLTIRIADLVAAPRNPNQMTAEQFQALREFIKRVGFFQPILVAPLPDGKWEICDGHHRVRAAADLGYYEVPAVVKHPDDDNELLALGANLNRGSPEYNTVAYMLADFVKNGMAPADLAIVGLPVEDIQHLIDSVAHDAKKQLDDVVANAPSSVSAPAPGAVFVLEIPFKDAKSLKLAKRRLKKAGGGDLAAGLLKALAMEE